MRWLPHATCREEAGRSSLPRPSASFDEAHGRISRGAGIAADASRSIPGNGVDFPLKVDLPAWPSHKDRQELAVQPGQSQIALTSPAVARDALVAYAPAFWRPRYPGESDLLGFTPVLFWLTAALRPARTAVLGLGDGTLCFAICQASERLQVDGTCTGIHLADDPQAGIPALVMDHARHFYDGVLDLRAAGSAEQSIQELDDQDLVLVDLQQWPEDALESLPARISATGCLVVHGHRQSQGRAKRLRGMMPQASCLSLETGTGWMVLCNDPDVLADLLDASRGHFRRDVLTAFARLGSSLLAERDSEALASELARLRAEAGETQQHVARLEAEIAELSAALDLRGRKASQYQALYFDSEAELKKLRPLKAEARNAQIERQRKTEITAERDAVSIKLRESRELHYRETAALTVLLEKQRRLALQEADALRRLLDEARLRADTLALDNQALLSSTSWRITWPLRRLSSMLRGRGYRR